MSEARTFSPGPRFSTLDAIALLIGLVVGGDIGALAPAVGIAIGFVILHFFLFCNFVRMARSSELVWSALFVLLAGFTILTGQPPWAWTFAISFVSTVCLVALEIRKPSYHGVFWRQLNPNLPHWWEAQSR